MSNLNDPKNKDFCWPIIHLSRLLKFVALDEFLEVLDQRFVEAWINSSRIVVLIPCVPWSHARRPGLIQDTSFLVSQLRD